MLAFYLPFLTDGNTRNLCILAPKRIFRWLNLKSWSPIDHWTKYLTWRVAERSGCLRHLFLCWRLSLSQGLPEVKGFDLTALTQDDFLNLQAWAIKWRERKTLAWFHQVRLLEPRGTLSSLLDSLSKGTQKQARFFQVR